MYAIEFTINIHCHLYHLIDYPIGLLQSQIGRNIGRQRYMCIHIIAFMFRLSLSHCSVAIIACSSQLILVVPQLNTAISSCICCCCTCTQWNFYKLPVNIIYKIIIYASSVASPLPRWKTHIPVVVLIFRKLQGGNVLILLNYQPGFLYICSRTTSKTTKPPSQLSEMLDYVSAYGIGWKAFPIGSLEVTTMLWLEGSLIIWSQTSLCLLASETKKKVQPTLYNTPSLMNLYYSCPLNF